MFNRHLPSKKIQIENTEKAINFGRNFDNYIWAINEIGVIEFAKKDLLNNGNQELVIRSIMDFKKYVIYKIILKLDKII